MTEKEFQPAANILPPAHGLHIATAAVLDAYGRSEADYAEDAADPQTVADLIAGRDFYGPSPLPHVPIMDPPGTEGTKAEMGRRAALGISIFDPSQDAKETARLGFRGSKWGYSGGQFRRGIAVVETSEGVKPVAAKLPPRKRRPSERQRSAVLREADRRRKRDERARAKAERGPGRRPPGRAFAVESKIVDAISKVGEGGGRHVTIQGECEGEPNGKV